MKAGLLTALALVWTFATALGQPVTVSIVGTGDVHGRIVSADARGGLALFGGYLRNLREARERDGGAVLVVDSGDIFQGTLESNPNEGAAMVRAYNALGYAAAAIGNHEFDFGPVGPAVTPRHPADDARGALKARAKEARFPLLAANVIDRATGQPVAWDNVHPSTMITAGGVKVGIIGVTTIDTLDKTMSLNTRGLAIAPLVPAITAEATRLRAAGAAVVIVAAHAGGRCTRFENPADLSSCEPQREIMTVAQALPAGAIDVIVAGHTHFRMAHEVAGIAVIQAGDNGHAFARVDLTVDRAAGKVTTRRIFPPQEIAADAAYERRRVTPDAAVAAAVVPAVAAAEALKRSPVGVVLDTTLPRVRERESALGNLFTDALRMSLPGSDVALLNGGAIRVDLPAGALTYGRLFETFPFDNRVLTLVMTGAQLRSIVTHDLLRPAGQITSLSGVRVHAACNAGQLVVDITRPNGARVTDTDRLRVLVSDFMKEGGDGILAPGGAALGSTDTGLLIRDVVAGWLGKRGGRINESALKPAQALRWNYEGERPVRCAAQAARVN